MNRSQPSRHGFGLLSLSCLVVANMIGAGVYTSSGYALAELGTPAWVLAAWVIAGVIAMLGAICYGGLARQLTASGGEYLFLSRAVHPLAGFMAGWVSLTAGFSGAIAYAAVTFEIYLPDGTWLVDRAPGLVACLLIGLFGALHFAGISAGARTQNLLVLVKLLLLGAFIAFGFAVIAGDGEGPSAAIASAVTMTNPPPIAVLATSVMWFSFSYAGYNAAVYVAGSSTGGATVARSMWIAAAVVTLLYLALNAVILIGTPSEALAGERDVLRIAAESIGGWRLQQVITGVILLSLATSVSAMVQAGPHVYAQMARDGMLPSSLTPPAGGVPRAAILVQTVLAIILALATNLQQLLDYLAFLLSLSSAATVACLLLPRLSGRRGDRPVFLWPLTPILFITASLVIAGLALRFRLQTDPRGVVYALLVLPLGLVLYWLLRTKASGRRA